MGCWGFKPILTTGLRQSIHRLETPAAHDYYQLDSGCDGIIINLI